MELGIVLIVCIFISAIIICLIKGFYKDETVLPKRLSNKEFEMLEM